MSLFSYHDISGNEPEKDSFLLGMFNSFSEYTVTSNRESGLGRFDILLTPAIPGFKGIIIEVKKAGNDNIDNLLQSAFDQPINQKYFTDFKQLGHTSCVVIAAVFKGKDLYFKHENINF